MPAAFHANAIMKVLMGAVESSELLKQLRCRKLICG
jgi:hypothetical protein